MRLLRSVATFDPKNSLKFLGFPVFVMLGVARFCVAEVNDRGFAIFVDKQVVWSEVSMNDPSCM